MEALRRKQRDAKYRNKQGNDIDDINNNNNNNNNNNMPSSILFSDLPRASQFIPNKCKRVIFNRMQKCEITEIKCN